MQYEFKTPKEMLDKLMDGDIIAIDSTLEDMYLSLYHKEYASNYFFDQNPISLDFDALYNLYWNKFRSQNPEVYARLQASDDRISDDLGYSEVEFYAESGSESQLWGKISDGFHEKMYARYAEMIKKHMDDPYEYKVTSPASIEVSNNGSITIKDVPENSNSVVLYLNWPSEKQLPLDRFVEKLQESLSKNK